MTDSKGHGLQMPDGVLWHKRIIRGDETNLPAELILHRISTSSKTWCIHFTDHLTDGQPKLMAKLEVIDGDIFARYNPSLLDIINKGDNDWALHVFNMIELLVDYAVVCMAEQGLI
jgi:hypothetical protein